MTTSEPVTADWISKEIESDRAYRDRVREAVDQLVAAVRAAHNHEAGMAELRELVAGVDPDLLRLALNEALHEGALEITVDRHVRVSSAA